MVDRVGEAKMKIIEGLETFLQVAAFVVELCELGKKYAGAGK